ncbi:MAG: hypothetical protein CL879_04655 [Dehalococcoidia bacterium]|nr:hypothetical protein [Dehalococcoidia bacterium]
MRISYVQYGWHHRENHSLATDRFWLNIFRLFYMPFTPALVKDRIRFIGGQDQAFVALTDSVFQPGGDSAPI